MHNRIGHISRIRCISLRGLALERAKDLKEIFDPHLDTQLKAISLFAGPNGSGKTTILDTIRSAFEPEFLARLRRENMHADAISGLRLVFESGSEYVALFHQNGEPQDPRSISFWDWQHTSVFVRICDGVNGCHDLPVVESVLPMVGTVDAAYLKPLKNLLLQLGCPGKAWPSIHGGSTPIEAYESILTKFKRHFPAHAAPLHRDGPEFPHKPGDIVSINGELHMYHGDDLAQSSRIPIEYLPSGWQQIAELLHWLEEREDHSICVMDEPERHLHPTLQRALIAELSEVRKRKHLQLIIATHSPLFLNARIWATEDVGIFHISQGRIIAEPKIDALLDHLGCLASDLFLSNGVIWVEGPSDRIYIKAFLRAWQSAHPMTLEFIENVHYSFSMFGGSCLPHYSGSDAASTSKTLNSKRNVDELIQLLSLNRNVAICMDQDNDFGIDDFGCLYPISEHGRTKARVAEELSQSPCAVVHITDLYTMECYIADLMPKGFLDTAGGGVKVNGSKVNHALRFSQFSAETIAACITRNASLQHFVETLTKSIAKWNHLT